MTLIQLTLVLAFLHFTITHAARMVLALYALNFGAGPVAVGVLSATYSAFPMVFAWIAGRFADRFGSRGPLLFCGTVSGLAMLVPYFAGTLASLYVSSALCGLSFAFYTVTLQNIVGSVGRGEDRSVNYANFTMVAAFATFAGPFIAGFSIDTLGFGLTCLALAAFALVPLALAAGPGRTLPREARREAPSAASPGILGDAGVLRVLAVSSLVVTAIDMFQFYLPIYGHQIGLSASAIGVILGMFALAAFVVRLAIPRLVSSTSERAILAAAFLLGAGTFVLIPLFKSALLLSACAFVFGLGLGCGAPITLTLTYDQSPKGRSAEALGLRLTLNHLARVISPLVFGAVGSAFGLFAVFWSNAALMLAGGLLAWLGLRGRRQSK